MDIFKSISIASPGTKRAKTELRNISQTDFDNFLSTQLNVLRGQTSVQGILSDIESVDDQNYVRKFAEHLKNEDSWNKFLKAIKFQADSLGTKRNGLFNTLIYNTTKSIDINKQQDRKKLYKKIMAFLKAQKDTDIRSNDPDVADEDRSARRMKNKSIFAKLISKRLSNILKVFMVLVLCVFIVMLNEQAEKEEAERKRKLEEKDREEKDRKEKAEKEEKRKRQKEEEEKTRKEEEKTRKEEAKAKAEKKHQEEAKRNEEEKKRRSEKEKEDREWQEKIASLKAEDEKKTKEKTEKAYQVWVQGYHEKITKTFEQKIDITEEDIKKFLEEISRLQTDIKIEVIEKCDAEVWVDRNDVRLTARVLKEDADKLKEELQTAAKGKILALLKSYMEKIEIEKTTKELQDLTHAEDITTIKQDDVWEKRKNLRDKISEIEKCFNFAMTNTWELSDELAEALKSAKEEIKYAEPKGEFEEKQKKAAEEKYERKSKKEKEERDRAWQDKKRKEAEEKGKKEKEKLEEQVADIIEMRQKLKNTAGRLFDLWKAYKNYQASVRGLLLGLQMGELTKIRHRGSGYSQDVTNSLKYYTILDVYYNEIENAREIKIYEQYDGDVYKAYEKFWASTERPKKLELAEGEYPDSQKVTEANDLYERYRRSRKYIEALNKAIDEDQEFMGKVLSISGKKLDDKSLLEQLKNLRKETGDKYTFISDSVYSQKKLCQDINWIISLLEIKTDDVKRQLAEKVDNDKRSLEWIDDFLNKEMTKDSTLPEMPQKMQDALNKDVFGGNVGFVNAYNAIFNLNKNSDRYKKDLQGQKSALETMRPGMLQRWGANVKITSKLVEQLINFIDKKIN